MKWDGIFAQIEIEIEKVRELSCWNCLASHVCVCVCQIGNDFTLPSLYSYLFYSAALNLCVQEVSTEKNDKNSLFRSPFHSVIIYFTGIPFNSSSRMFVPFTIHAFWAKIRNLMYMECVCVCVYAGLIRTQTDPIQERKKEGEYVRMGIKKVNPHFGIRLCIGYTYRGHSNMKHKTTQQRRISGKCREMLSENNIYEP